MSFDHPEWPDGVEEQSGWGREAAMLEFLGHHPRSELLARAAADPTFPHHGLVIRALKAPPVSVMSGSFSSVCGSFTSSKVPRTTPLLSKESM